MGDELPDHLQVVVQEVSESGFCSWLAAACASSVGKRWLTSSLDVDGGLLPGGGMVHVLG